MGKLLLVDGSSLLTTSFFGNLPREYYRIKTEEDRASVFQKVLQTPNGQFTNGVFTMMRWLERIMKQQEPSHLAIAWDVSRDTFRRKLYPLYKAHRGEIPQELKSQFALAQRVLDAMHIQQFAFDDFEADDIIGTFAKRFRDEIPVYILTKDQDALQLVGGRERVWLLTSKARQMYEQVGLHYKEVAAPDNTFEFTDMYVEEFYGLKPHQIIDMKALEGDKSDNIPGVKGVGEKAVIPLLQEFGSVESLYEYVEDTPEKEAKLFFRELGINRSPLANLTKTSETELVGKEAALLSKQLATINCELECLTDVQLSDLVLQIDNDGRRSIYEELSFDSLIA
jgi:5'-3' exonuclease